MERGGGSMQPVFPFLISRTFLLTPRTLLQLFSAPSSPHLFFFFDYLITHTSFFLPFLSLFSLAEAKWGIC